MPKTNSFFAVDLGATSGRTIVGHLTDGKITLEELTRFDNRLIQTGGHVYWDIFALYDEVIRGLQKAAQRGISLMSIGIDTWGVDFLCVGNDGAILRNPLSYRDPHTVGVMDEYLRDVKPRQDVYHITGIQFMNFNSLFQLYAMRKADNSALRQASKILFMPDALSYMLTGEMVCEYTIASTSQMLNPRTRALDDSLLDSVGLNRNHFGRDVNPGTVIGSLTPEVQRLTGLGALPVVAVAGHDTASAVAAVPARDSGFAYLSSGTWSLMGVETPEPVICDRSYELNFTNEGGVEGTTRFLKNICGMWLYERSRKELPDAPASHSELLVEMVKQQAFRSLINPDDPVFANPPSMVTAIQDYCRQTQQPVPEDYAQICRCIFDSLALRYREVFTRLKEFAPFDIDVLHIIGGGSLNQYLNQFTANALGIEVLAGPQEATALGNIMLQARAAGEVSDIWQMRRIIADSITLRRFTPANLHEWGMAYEKYQSIVNLSSQ